MTNVILMITTTGDRASAETIARELVADRLAACVQISGPITSFYRWRGEIETAEEWSCAIKTRKELYGRAEARIRQLHPYEEPEIVALNIAAGSTSYLSWLGAQLEPFDKPEPDRRD